ncbi:MAG: hypothetical protein SVY53_02290 [Chloroflexota bacterium]|nr:hypothetical protein [Chloroflexota bacterium]
MIDIVCRAKPACHSEQSEAISRVSSWSFSKISSSLEFLIIKSNFVFAQHHADGAKCIIV